MDRSPFRSPTTCRPACLDVAILLQEARAARPELRGAELTVEAAAGRAGVSRLEAIGLVAILDANQKGIEGFEAGPGFEVQLPLFHLGGAAQQRAEAELVRARARLLALHQQVELEVRDARTRLIEAEAVLAAWEEVVATREDDLRSRVKRQRRPARTPCWWFSSRSGYSRTPACAAPTRTPSCARPGHAWPGPWDASPPAEERHEHAPCASR